MESLLNQKVLKSLSIGWDQTLTILPEKMNDILDLENLTISGSREHVCPVLPERLGDLSALQTLHLSNFYGLSERLGDLVGLQTLTISYCHTLTALPERLSDLMGLQTLKIGYCDALRFLPKRLPVLKTLLISNCPVLTSFPKRLQALQTLIIVECNSFSALPKRMPVLQRLDLFKCPNLSALPKRLSTTLQELDIWICPNLRRLPTQLGELKALKTLCLCYCDRITTLPESLKALTRLHLVNCACITLPERLGNLKFFICQQCPQVLIFPESYRQLKCTMHFSEALNKAWGDQKKIWQTAYWTPQTFKWCSTDLHAVIWTALLCGKRRDSNLCTDMWCYIFSFFQPWNIFCLSY